MLNLKGTPEWQLDRQVSGNFGQAKADHKTCKHQVTPENRLYEQHEPRVPSSPFISISLAPRRCWSGNQGEKGSRNSLAEQVLSVHAHRSKNRASILRGSSRGNFSFLRQTADVPAGRCKGTQHEITRITRDTLEVGKLLRTIVCRVSFFFPIGSISEIGIEFRDSRQ